MELEQRQKDGRIKEIRIYGDSSEGVDLYRTQKLIAEMRQGKRKDDVVELEKFLKDKRK